MKKILKTIAVVLLIYMSWLALSRTMSSSTILDSAFLSGLLVVLFFSINTLLIVWLLGNCWEIINIKLDKRDFFDFINNRENKIKIICIISLFLAVYPFGYNFMGYLLYQLMETSPLISLIGLILYPIIWIICFFICYIQLGSGSEDAKYWGIGIQMALKTCPSCMKKLPSRFTAKCPYCTAELPKL